MWCSPRAGLCVLSEKRRGGGESVSVGHVVVSGTSKARVPGGNRRPMGGCSAWAVSAWGCLFQGLGVRCYCRSTRKDEGSRACRQAPCFVRARWRSCMRFCVRTLFTCFFYHPLAWGVLSVASSFRLLAHPSRWTTHTKLHTDTHPQAGQDKDELPPPPCHAGGGAVQ